MSGKTGRLEGVWPRRGRVGGQQKNNDGPAALARLSQKVLSRIADRAKLVQCVLSLDLVKSQVYQFRDLGLASRRWQMICALVRVRDNSGILKSPLNRYLGLVLNLQRLVDGSAQRVAFAWCGHDTIQSYPCHGLLEAAGHELVELRGV